jgi:hypothetical protein
VLPGAARELEHPRAGWDRGAQDLEQRRAVALRGGAVFAGQGRVPPSANTSSIQTESDPDDTLPSL